MSARSIGVRREDKHEWERRTPLTPDAVRSLIEESGLEVRVQSSPIRIHPDADYADAGAIVTGEMPNADVVFAVKEIPADLFRPHGAYVFFSHTIKGQSHSMPMLRRLQELGCTLIDYEPIADDEGRRLVFFGRHAGLAGMIDTLWLVGKRLEAQGLETPFREIRLAHQYASLDEAREHIRAVGAAIRHDGLPAEIVPFVCGITGYGNVSQGAQEVFDLLGGESVNPTEAAALLERDRTDPELGRMVFKVVYRNRHLFQPSSEGVPFVREEYFAHPDRHRSIFHRHVPTLSMLVNAIYWAPEAPRLLTRDDLRDWFEREPVPRLRVVGDISCDIGGAIECTVKATTPGAPSYVFRPDTGEVADGYTGPGLAMMTTDCLPCELPRESSASFTDALLPFVPAIANADYGAALDESGLPDVIKRATVLWRGELTPDFEYLRASVSS